LTNTLFLRESKVYENLKEDYKKKKKNYTSWWEVTFEKYGLEKNEAEKYQVDFGKKAIIKMDEAY
jgi:CXXX repeat modification system protein